MDWSKFVGLPWRDRGRDASGYDCWGLAAAAFEAGIGIALPTYTDEYRSAAQTDRAVELIAQESSAWEKVGSDQAREFDAVVLKIERRFHIGLTVRRGLMLHMPYRGTSVIEPIARRGVLDGIYRHKRLI